MKTGASSPLNPYVRLIIDGSGDYVLETMFNVHESCVAEGSVQNGDYETLLGVAPPTGFSYAVLFTLDQEYEEEVGCKFAVTTVKLPNVSTSPSGGIWVQASWAATETADIKGPETPGKTVIQFEDALDQR